MADRRETVTTLQTLSPLREVLACGDHPHRYALPPSRLPDAGVAGVVEPAETAGSVQQPSRRDGSGDRPRGLAAGTCDCPLIVS